jgi:hypothetical protein
LPPSSGFKSKLSRKLAALPVSCLAYSLTQEDHPVHSHHRENLSSNNTNSCFLFQLLDFPQKLFYQFPISYHRQNREHSVILQNFLFTVPGICDSQGCCGDAEALVYNLWVWFKSSF